MALPPADPLLAALSPPRAERLRERAGIEADETLVADFTGWSKLVFLAKDRALLFPRNHELVGAFRNELEALRVVEAAGIREIPRVLDVWDDPTLSPYPIASITRVPGIPLEAVLGEIDAAALGRISERLGLLAARWQTVDPGPLAQRPPRDLPHRTGLADLLGTSQNPPAPGELLASLAPTLKIGSAFLQRATAAIARARTLDPVLVHSDIHEGQLLVDPGQGFAVTGVIDWQTAGVGHPFSEFDLGQWGPTLWREHRAEFPELRRRYWETYAAARDLRGDLGADFEWIWSVSHALRLADAAAADPRVLGSLDEALERVFEATLQLA